MSLSRRAFFWRSAKQAWDSAKTAKGIIASVLGGLLGAASMWFGIHWGESLLIWIPATVFVIVLLVAIFYHAHGIYLESDKEREKLAQQLNDFKRPKVVIVGVDHQSLLSFRQIHRVRVKNTSGMTVQDCRLRVVGSLPPGICDSITLPSGTWTPAKYSIDLAPGDEDAFTVCEVMGEQHIIRGEEADVPLPEEKIVLVLRVNGKDAMTVEFQVMIDPHSEQIASLVLPST
jgi:hypothetical protein